MSTQHPRLLRGALFALACCGFATCQVDVAALQPRVVAATAAQQQALQQCQRALQAVRQAIGDPDNKVQGDCTDIGNVLGGGTFDAALGSIPIALEHLEYVAEDKREATKAALLALRQELAGGSLALQRQEALQELVSRGEYLAGLGADGDASAALVDFASSLGRATRSQALPREDIALLQQQLAKHRLQNAARLGQELAQQAKTDLAQLQQDFPSMRSQMGDQDGSVRDRGFARFDEAARNICTALARVASKDRQNPAAELAKLAAVADELYAKGYGASTATRIRETWAITTDQFEGWRDEAAAISAQGYVDFDPPNVDVLCSPRTVALVARANAWLAFVGQDFDYVRNRQHPDVAAFTRSILDQRQAAHEKLLPLAKAVVDGLAALEISEERTRGRLQTFADWDLPLALSLHPELTVLRARVHAALDAHDRKALGDEKAMATIREQALVAADGLWPRLCACLPAAGGFAPADSALFVGKLMRLEGVWLRTTEFGAGSHDLVFDLGGHVFAGSMTPGLALAVDLAKKRLQLGEALPADEGCELLAVVGEELELTLLGRKGKEDAMVVPARAMRIVGLRQGALFAVAP